MSAHRLLSFFVPLRLLRLGEGGPSRLSSSPVQVLAIQQARSVSDAGLLTGAPLLQLHEADGVRTVCVPAGQRLRLTVTQGRLWLTVAGQAGDEVLAAGQTRCVTGPARVALGALVLEGRPPAREAGAHSAPGVADEACVYTCMLRMTLV